MIDKTTEQKIKEAANIVDVISDFLTLKKRGSHYETLCPFHDDRRLGSFVVSPSHNCFVCYSCGAKGGPIEFLMKHQSMNYPDALRWLAQKYGIFVDEEQYGISRDALYEKMKVNNVLGRRYFYPLITDFDPYKDIPSANPANLPVANKIANQVICLPMHHALSEEDVKRVIDCIRK